MAIRDMMNGVTKTSQARLSAYRAWESAERGFEAALEQLGRYVTDDFGRYLAEHPEIPVEPYGAAVGNKDHEKWAFGPSEAEKRATPYNSGNIFVDVVIGNPDEPDMHDALGFGAHTPRDVSSRFQGFLERNRPLEIRVLRYFSSGEGWGTPDPFYGDIGLQQGTVTN